VYIIVEVTKRRESWSGHKNKSWNRRIRGSASSEHLKDKR
jgi:hypothetical protein